MKQIRKILVLVAMLLSAGMSAFAQDDGKRRITGTVSDENGEPLIGAYVYIKGTQVGTTTNLDGMYVIDIEKKDQLTFSFIGFLDKTVTPRATSNTLNVKLETDALMAEEAVVVAYGSQKRQAVVSSLSTVSSDKIKVTSSNITSSLQGQMPGLISVQRTAEPGRDDAEFWIRGVSSFKGGTSPLVLVDGVPRSMGDLDADEIDSFSLLKDAAATAMYGAEGANGVILVTTKRGQLSKPKIQFRVEQSVASPQRLPDYVDSWTYMEMVNEAKVNDGTSPVYSDELIERYRSGEDPDMYPNVDWMDLFSKAVHSQRYTINFRGGAENAKYFVSGGYYQTDGVFKENKDKNALYNSNFSLNRFNLRSNVDLKVSKTTQLSIDLAAQYSDRRTANRSADDIFKFMLHTPPHLFPMVYSDGTLSTYPEKGDVNIRNPYNMLYNQGYRHEYKTKIQTKVNVNQDLNFITKGLSARAMVSFDYNNTASTLRDYHPDLYHLDRYDPVTNEPIYKVVYDETGLIDDLKWQGTQGNTRKIYIEAALQYNNVFAGKHAVGAMLLYNQKETQHMQESNNATKNVLPFRKQGLVGRITYGYDNRYFIEANFGYTGSETFHAKNRFGFFPAVGVSYMISNESWYPQALKDVMSSAKIRASFGRTGNDDTGGDRFLYRATYGTDGYEFHQGIQNDGSGTNKIPDGKGIYDKLFENVTLGWEIENKTNVGLDLAFFDRSIQLSADYFYNRRSDILVQRNTIYGIAGFNAKPWQNYGIVDNQGFDASLELFRQFGDWKVSARGTFTFARNKIIEMDELPPLEAYQAETGHSVKSNYVYIAERLYTEEDFIKTSNGYKLKPGLPAHNLEGNTFIGPGDIKYKDVNHDGVVDNNDRVRGIGFPTVPEINYGFGFNVEWKGIYASIFFTGAGNASALIAQGDDRFWPFIYGENKGNFRSVFLDRWHDGNQSQDVFSPRLHIGYGNNPNKEPNTWWLKDASYIRLKNFEVGYSLPAKALRAIKLSGVRFYVLGENLAVWDKVKYVDPEHMARNNGANYPLSRTFTFGVEVNF